MSDFEMLLTAWLNGGEIPADFKPTSRVEEYLLAILNGVDDDVDPKSRADVLLDAIAAKYAGYADGLNDLRDTLGFTGHPVYDDATTPELIAAAQKAVNVVALIDLQTKGVTGVDNNTIALLDAYENLPSGGAELNIAYGDTAPEDTTKLWVKTARPQNVTVDFDLDNGVESVQALTAVLPNASREIACGVVGTKLYLFGGFHSGFLNKINVFDTETETLTTLTTTLPKASSAIGCGVVGTKIYLFGGGAATSPYQLTTIYAFDTTNNTITTLATTLPSKRTNIACGVVGTKIYLFGGYDGSYVNTIDVFDTETETITTLPVTLSTAAITTCIAVGTKCYLFGGGNSGGSLNTINVFDTTDNSITTLATTLPSATEFANLAALGTKIYVIGGYGLNTINVFDTTDNSITTLAATTLTNIGNSACGVVGNTVYILGGWTGSDDTNAGEKFTVTFPLNNGDLYLQEHLYKNKFTLVNAPTEVKTGVSAVYVGNASNEAEYADALLYDGAAWQPIT